MEIALGLPVDHRGWNASTLTRFRARLLLHGKERLALENTLGLARELGLLEAPAEQIVDSTPMLGAAATQDTVRLVRSGVRKLIDAVADADEAAAPTARRRARVRLCGAGRQARLSLAREAGAGADADARGRGRRARPARR